VERPFFVVLNDKEEAAYYLNDLEQMIGARRTVLSRFLSPSVPN
jgi:transcription-repair coupling factor (superfamily II helicase)